MTPDTLDRVLTACQELRRSGSRVTFAAVAGRLGMTRAVLYRHRELRDCIDSYRGPSSELLTLTSLAARVDNLTQSLEAMAAQVRHHDTELRELKRTTRTPGRSRSKS